MTRMLTRAQFIGTYAIVERFYEDPARNARRERLFSRKEQLQELANGIVLYRGEYRVPPLSVRHAFENPFVLAESPQEGLVGFGVLGRVWVQSSYRGQGLGTTLCAQAFLLTPLEKWLAYTSSFTPAGLRNRYRAYDLLLREGRVTPPPTGASTL